MKKRRWYRRVFRGSSHANSSPMPAAPTARCVETSIRLAKHFTDVQFVLRPHPFENIASYDALAELPNFQVRQDGTSLEWISGARLLIHQNCSTAIEATMLKVEPLSMEWFNTPSLRLDFATRVSRGAESEFDLIEFVRQGLDGRLPPVAGETEQFRRHIVSDLYHRRRWRELVAGHCGGSRYYCCGTWCKSQHVQAGAAVTPR